MGSDSVLLSEPFAYLFIRGLLRLSGRASASGTCINGQSATNGQVMSIYTVTAREREPGEGERGSPAAGKGVVCLRHKLMDRRAYMCLTARTLAMTGKNAHRFVDRWARRIGIRGKALSGQVRASRTCWQNALIG